MKTKYSDVVADWLFELGYTHCFFVAGGGCMHLIDGFRKKFELIPVVHEVTAGIAAEHFNECSSSGKAFALVTTGPGLTNIVTAVAGCYTERRELLIIAGQVKSTDRLTPPIRQLGVQEVDGTTLCRSITVRSACLDKPISKEIFTEYALSAKGPHPGPVLIEICLDVQGAIVDREELELTSFNSIRQVTQNKERQATQNTDSFWTQVATELKNARRPLLLLGGLVNRQTANALLPHLLRTGIPVMTTTSAIDRIHSDSPIFAGRPGTWGGQRAANMLLAQADFVMVVGAQLDLQQTGFNTQHYAPMAKLFQVYPCPGEISKPSPPLHRSLNADPNESLRQFCMVMNWSDGERWLEYVQSVRKRLPALETANEKRIGYCSSFEFLRNLSLASDSHDILALSSSGGTFTGALQMYEIKPGQIASTSSAFASMGYGLATAIGASFANPGRRVLLVEGDGGFSQNLQELALVKRHCLPVKIFIFDNEGYASIRSTQRKFFNGAYAGCDSKTGLGFPNWPKLFDAFDIKCAEILPDEIGVDSLAQKLKTDDGPSAFILRTDPEQTNWPAVASILNSDGTMNSAPLYEMLPRLPSEVLREVGRYLPTTLE